jgi:ribosomal protein S18 acetylase RimI-like enzyme
VWAVWASRESLVASSVQIRIAVGSDAELLATLGARTFRDTFGPDNTEADMDEYLESAFTPEVQTKELADPASTFLIAEADGSAAGYARLRLGAQPTCIAGTSPIEIARFYADAPWIGRGVGPALMSACLDIARQSMCDVLWLDVWERNFRAMAFYRKWGFVVVGAQPFVLGTDVQTDLLMSRPLDESTV